VKPCEEAKVVLDAICRDSLETPLAVILANREHSLSEEVSAMFVTLSDSLDALASRLEAAEAALLGLFRQALDGGFPVESVTPDSSYAMRVTVTGRALHAARAALDGKE